MSFVVGVDSEDFFRIRGLRVVEVGVVEIGIVELVIGRRVIDIEGELVNVGWNQVAFEEGKATLLAHPGKRVDGFEVVCFGQTGTLPPELESPHRTSPRTDQKSTHRRAIGSIVHPELNGETRRIGKAQKAR